MCTLLSPTELLNPIDVYGELWGHIYDGLLFIFIHMFWNTILIYAQLLFLKMSMVEPWFTWIRLLLLLMFLWNPGLLSFLDIYGETFGSISLLLDVLNILKPRFIYIKLKLEVAYCIS